MNNNIFTSANILLPGIKADSPMWERWAIIACDQFTSQPEYWNEVKRLTTGAMSTYSLVLPEAYLETEDVDCQRELIADAMNNVPEMLSCYKNSMVYLERTLPDGSLRRGIVGNIDLEKYDYIFENKPLVSATEETVIERIPPRVNIRRLASIELPHIMVFYDDIEDRIMSYLDKVKSKLEKLYSFELMMGGGTVCGYKVDGEILEKLSVLIAEYEASKNGTVYAVGDGNHSLAGAKTYYNEVKAQLGEAAKKHPARYALCEIVNIHEKSIEFEPIYRILKNVDIDDFLSSLPSEGRKLTAYVGSDKRDVFFPDSHPIDIGCMQSFIDAYIKDHPQVVCDYIHGVDALIELSEEANSIGFLCEGIAKDALLPYVAENGSLPRKTFSMGEAKSKRYYIEARKI